MAVIRIKRSTSAVGPSSLATGEIAVNIEQSTQGTYLNQAGRLWVGDSTGTPVQVGGEYYTELLNHQPNQLINDSAVIVGASGTISGWNVAGLATMTDAYVSNQLDVTTLRVNAGQATEFTIDDLQIIGIATVPRTDINDLVARNLRVTGVGTFDGAVSAASSVSIGTVFYAINDGSIYGSSLQLSGAATEEFAFFDSNQNIISPENISYARTEGLLQTEIVGIQTLRAVAGVVTTIEGTTLSYTSGTIETITAGAASSQYTLPTGAGGTAFYLRADGTGGTEFAKLDLRLQTQSDSLAGSVGLTSEVFDIIGTAQEIVTSAPGIGRTIQIGFPNDIVVGGAATFGGAVAIGGSLTVQGNLTYLDSTITQIQDKKIDLAYSDSPSDAAADGGGISLKGNADYEIVWINATNAWTVNQSWFPLSSNLYDLGSDSQQWRNLYVDGAANLDDVNVAGVATIAQVDIDSGSMDNTVIGAALSESARFTDITYSTATAGFIDVSGVGTFATLEATNLTIDNLETQNFKSTGISTLTTVFFDENPALNAVGYAGTDGILGFTSAPASGISSSTYILTVHEGVPVFTDTIDCGTY